MRIAWKMALAALLAAAVGFGGLLGVVAPGTGRALADADRVWGVVGNAGFSPGQAGSLDMEVDTDGTIYVAYTNWADGKVTVMKYSGGSWSTVGNAGFTTGPVSSLSLEVHQGTPYVAFVDESRSNRATLMTFNGSSWATVGGAGFSAGATNYVSLFNDNGTLYVAYQDQTSSFVGRVMRYNGSGWDTIGGAGSSFSSAQANDISLYVYEGTVYVAYRDVTSGSKATVKKYNGSAWEAVGGTAFTPTQAADITLIVADGVLYMAYENNQASVMKYNGSSWETVGGGPVWGGQARDISMVVDGGVPYVSFMEYPDTRIFVRRFTGSAWENAGSGDYTSGVGAKTAVDMHNGVPYVAFRDGGASSRATVRKLLDSVAYDGNGSTGGSVPATAGYDRNATVTVSGNTGNLIRTGYTFAGWNTAADGSGTSYGAGSTFPMGTAGVTLYAQWAANSYPVAYAGNGSTGGSAPATADYNYGANVTVEGNTGNLVRTGYTFAGWNTAANGSGTSYAAGATFPMGMAGVTLYAQWTINSYPVVYAGNGSTGGSAPATADYDYGASVTVEGNTGNLVRTGYTFAGWNTAANGSGTSYGAGATFPMGTAGVTLYAHWSANSYTVSFNSNGGTPVSPQTIVYGNKASEPTAPGKTGCTFAGWYSDEALTIPYSFAENIGAADMTLYAKWTVNSYTVTYDGNGATSGSAPSAASHQYNTSVTVEGNSGVLARTGHTFAGWNTAADGTGTDYAESVPFTMGAADVTLYAKWTVNGYTVSFESNGGTAAASQTVSYGSAAVQPADPAKTGHTFAGWYADAGLTAAYDFAAPIGAADVTLYAKWTINSYTVTYDGNGATSGDVPADSSHVYNTSITVPGNPGGLAKTGHTFAGWNTAADGSGTDYAESVPFTMGAADVTLYAKWTVNGYTVSFESNGGTAAASQTVSYGSAAVQPADPAKTGHTFAGWYADAGLTAAYDFAAPIGAADVTLYAKWTINSYTVTYDGNGATSGDVPADSSHVYNTVVTVPGNPGGLAKTGHTFAGWNTAADGSGTDYDESAAFTIQAADVTLYAKWTVNGYTVSFGSNGGTAVASQTVSYGTAAVQPADPAKTGHTFAGWYADAGLTAAYDFAAPIGAADVTLYAKWTINSYTVTYDGNGAMSGDVPADSSHVYNTVVTVPGNPGGLAKTGHTFAGWNTAADGSGTDYAESAVFTILAANETLYAKWTVNDYTVSFESSGGTAVASQTVSYGNTAVQPADPAKTGHTFAGWYADADLTTAYDFTAPIGAADVTLYAKWTINSYTVTYDGNGAMSGDVPASSSHDYGTDFAVAGNSGSLVKTGYSFAGWNTAADGAGTNYAESETFTMGAADVTLYAKWTGNNYTVSFESNGGTAVASQTASYGSTALQPANPTKPGYAFAGWYTDRDALTQPFDFTSPVGADDVTLYAKWFSANAMLAALSTDQGTLRPAFSPSEASYVIDAAKAVTSFNLFLKKGDPTQSISVTGATYISVTDDVYAYNVTNLTVGPNPIPILITVTAESLEQNTYRLTVNVSPDEAMGQPIALHPSVRRLTFPGGLSIRFPDELSIPPGATLTVRHSNAAPSGEVKLAKAGQAIDFQFEGITIDRPVEITLGHDGNAAPGKLAIYYYNEATGKWAYQPSQATGSGIKASVDHFSTFGVLADTTAPDRVTVASGDKTTSAIALHLAASDDSGVAKYLIYRDGTHVAETTERTYVDTGLSAARTYVYSVKAVDPLGNISALSESITVATNGDGGGGGGGNPGGGAPGGTVAAPDKVVSTNGTLTIPAGRPGEVRLGHEIKIEIPAGASDGELKITIEKAADALQLIRSDDLLISAVFEVLKNFAGDFSKEVALTLVFDPTILKEGQKPSVFYYDESKRVWVDIGGEVSGNTITATVNHFTKFAVFAVGRESESTPEAEPKDRLSDIAGHWAESSIRAASAADIVRGYADGTFQPNAAVTRAEFAVMLMNALKLPGTGAELTFADTAEIGAWAATAVAQAAEAGIATGYGDGRFRPAANITRAELAVMIARAYGADIESDASTTTGFADDGHIPEWAKGAVSAVRQSGIVQGRSDHRFEPDATATRAEAVTMIMNLLQKLNG